MFDFGDFVGKPFVLTAAIASSKLRPETGQTELIKNIFYFSGFFTNKNSNTVLF